MEKRKAKNVSLSTVIENREVELKVHRTRYGTESLTYLANKIWSQTPTDIKEAPTLELFREKIKLWQISDCPCRLCKTYIQHIGFI